MTGDNDSIFDNLPLSQGYQAMPSSPNIEDRRTGLAPATPAGDAARQGVNLNAQILSQYPPGTHVYDLDQWNWLQAHFPQQIPTTPLPDPDFSLDPSIMARAKAQQARPPPPPYWMQPATIPPGPRSGPQFSSTGNQILRLLGGGGRP